MSYKKLLFVFVFVFLVSVTVSQSSDSSWDSEPEYFTVYQNPSNGGFIVKPVKDQTGIAYAAYSNDMNITGWGYLSLTTNKQFPDLLQASAAGYLEGYITQSMIWQNWVNMYVNEYTSSISEPVQNWMADNVAYMAQQYGAYSGLESSTDTDAFNQTYWSHVQLVMTQMISMVDGYNNATTDSSQYLDVLAFMLMNSDGDMIDLGPALNLTNGGGSSSAEEQKSLKERLNVWIRKTGHCSALIKLTDDLSDLYSGHTTWSSYYEMVRIFKIYTFQFTQTYSHSNTVLFSSYPATLTSVDDFYLLDSKLVVIETTNGIINADNALYYLIKPQSILSWIRVMVSNRLATGGNEWCEIFSVQNSGTYNNQWIIVDYNKFTPYKNLANGGLFILEQLPGYIEFTDATAILRESHWGSYNIPFFENVYNMSGFNNTAQYGNWFSYVSSPRAEIFRRDAGNIHDFKDFKDMLRYNNWQQDPLSLGNAGNQISSRFDLVTEDDPTNPFLNPGAFGGIDSKVVNYFQVDRLQVSAQSGPSHDSEKPFRWDVKEWEGITHAGQPDVWDFDWVDFTYSDN
ncbi:phospholipase B [Tieghemostelium lacteum]|uniref:Phospholipase B-like n=1 Tax=Tieghemostelium lacteum TaxID=361077 RepID=A0A151ZS64_TIELA|nr:phospholipase B [Tieghemostelium lacteum]|eukprot:KYQ96786.1 phospholipase B [Tieghemostelium lacteum]